MRVIAAMSRGSAGRMGMVVDILVMPEQSLGPAHPLLIRKTVGQWVKPGNDELPTTHKKNAPAFGRGVAVQSVPCAISGGRRSAAA